LYHAVDVGPALAIFAGAVATFLAIGLAFGAGTPGMVASQLGGLAGATLVATRWLTGSLAALGVVRPRGRAVVGAVLIGASFWYVNLRLSLPVAEWLGGEEELARFQSRWLTDRDLGAMVVTLAVVPGLCEELLCRGLLARALAGRYRTWIAVAASAVAFSLLHLSLPRALPTFSLGLVLGWVALASGSLWPSVIAHTINNAVAIAIAQGSLGPLATAIRDHHALALGVAAASSLLGGFLVISTQRNQHDTTS
jgi:sodium transport system permease protein